MPACFVTSEARYASLPRCDWGFLRSVEGGRKRGGRVCVHVHQATTLRQALLQPNYQGSPTVESPRFFTSVVV